MTMKTIEVAAATNAQLNWLVAKCERDTGVDRTAHNGRRYSTSWFRMGQIIEREGIDVRFGRYRVFDPGEKVERWYASIPSDTPGVEWTEYGPTPLIAAARCYVTSKLGETVEVPEELT
jgi:hypothetical protein